MVRSFRKVVVMLALARALGVIINPQGMATWK